MALSVIRINDETYSWTSCLFKIDNQPTQDILGWDYEQKRERKIVYGSKQDGRPRARTAGKYSVQPSQLRMLRDAAFLFKTYLTTKGAGSYGDAKFDMQLVVSEPVAGEVPLVVNAESCAITGEKNVHAEGVDELVTEFELSIMQMTENGMQLWSLVRGLTGDL